MGKSVPASRVQSCTWGKPQPLQSAMADQALLIPHHSDIYILLSLSFKYKDPFDDIGPPG